LRTYFVAPFVLQTLLLRLREHFATYRLLHVVLPFYLCRSLHRLTGCAAWFPHVPFVCVQPPHLHLPPYKTPFAFSFVSFRCWTPRDVEHHRVRHSVLRSRFRLWLSPLTYADHHCSTRAVRAQIIQFTTFLRSRHSPSLAAAAHHFAYITFSWFRLRLLAPLVSGSRSSRVACGLPFRLLVSFAAAFVLHRLGFRTAGRLRCCYRAPRFWVPTRWYGCIACYLLHNTGSRLNNGIWFVLGLAPHTRAFYRFTRCRFTRLDACVPRSAVRLPVFGLLGTLTRTNRNCALTAGFFLYIRALNAVCLPGRCYALLHGWCCLRGRFRSLRSPNAAVPLSHRSLDFIVCWFVYTGRP